MLIGFYVDIPVPHDFMESFENIRENCKNLDALFFSGYVHSCANLRKKNIKITKYQSIKASNYLYKYEI